MSKYAAFGTELQLEDDPPTGVFTTIAHLTSLNGPTGGDTEELDVTSHDSPGGAREFVASFKGAEEITFNIFYDPNHATHNTATGLVGLKASGAVRSWQLALPTTPAANIAFNGFVKSFGLATPFDGAITADVTIRVSGEVTWP